jgi:hypothetical protein
LHGIDKRTVGRVDRALSSVHQNELRFIRTPKCGSAVLMMDMHTGFKTARVMAIGDGVFVIQ